MIKGSVSDETATHACLTLANLADDSAEGQDMIARAGAIKPLVALIQLPDLAVEAAAAELLARGPVDRWRRVLELVCDLSERRGELVRARVLGSESRR